MASVGVGSSPHVSGEMFQMMTGVKMVHVPFHGGGAALNALLGGQCDQLTIAGLLLIGSSLRAPSWAR